MVAAARLLSRLEERNVGLPFFSTLNIGAPGQGECRL